ncbi:Rho termination factor N-terminal domain-containing protein [Pseudomonas citronellolis]|uniref:Rho termination factor N-terminal domain-containing protein n=1 Tax=Pseudomonas citronellolis TaxID=53408 RepID=UPI0023E3D8A4|nr:Rho termination factor N-terminal domain-containing protein [Pseudomonas citronellolis]MDF3934464.1 Rho termination factor N-terminal domain-containing protein [Pseudomonas citronellolis]
MSRASKDTYSAEQKRKARHIEESYERQGVPADEARARAWATVNKQSGGGELKDGSGRATSERAKAAARRSSARRAAATRKGVLRPDRPLEAMNKQELLAVARARNIAGRSTMRKQQLIEALR